MKLKQILMCILIYLISFQVVWGDEHISPVARLESTHLMHYGNNITFDGSNSYDPNGEIILYQWEITSMKDQVKLLLEGVNPNVDLEKGFYDVLLKVTDNEGAIGEDQMLLAMTGQCTFDINQDSKLGLEEAIYTLREIAILNSPVTPDKIVIDSQDFSTLSEEKKDEISNCFIAQNPIILKNTNKEDIKKLLNIIDIDGLTVSFPNEIEDVQFYGIDIDKGEYWELIVVPVSESLSYTINDNEVISYSVETYSQEQLFNDDINTLLENWINNNNRLSSDNSFRKKIYSEIKNTDLDDPDIDLNKLAKFYHKTILYNEPNGIYSFNYHYATVHQKTELDEEYDWFYLRQDCTLSPKTIKYNNNERIHNYIKKYEIGIGDFSDYNENKFCPNITIVEHRPENMIDNKLISYNISKTIGGEVSTNTNIGAGISFPQGIEINNETGIAFTKNKSNTFSYAAEYSIEDVEMTDLSDAFRAKWLYEIDDSDLDKNINESIINYPCKLSSSTFSPKHTIIFNINSKTIDGFYSVNVPVHFRWTRKNAAVINSKIYESIKEFEKVTYLTLPLTRKKEQLDFKISTFGNKVNLKIVNNQGLQKCEWNIYNCFDDDCNTTILPNYIGENCEEIEESLTISGYYLIKLDAIDINGINIPKTKTFYLPNSGKIIVDKNEVNFGNVDFEKLSYKQINVTNDSDVTTALKINTAPPFECTISDLVLLPKESKTIILKFKTITPGFHQGKLNIVANNSIDPISIDLYGKYQTKHKYQLFKFEDSESHTWSNAKSLCEIQGTHLAVITSIEENNYIQEIFQSNKSCWIGGYRISSSDNWKWCNGEEWIFTNWEVGEPSSHSFEHHVEMYLSNGKWNNEYLYKPDYYICEIE